jgi:hypothetical protein
MSGALPGQARTVTGTPTHRQLHAVWRRRSKLTSPAGKLQECTFLLILAEPCIVRPPGMLGAVPQLLTKATDSFGAYSLMLDWSRSGVRDTVRGPSAVACTGSVLKLPAVMLAALIAMLKVHWRLPLAGTVATPPVHARVCAAPPAVSTRLV